MKLNGKTRKLNKDEFLELDQFQATDYLVFVFILILLTFPLLNAKLGMRNKKLFIFSGVQNSV